MVESCLLKAAKMTGDLFSHEELIDIFNKAAEIKQKQIDLGLTDNLDARVADAIKKESQRTARKALAKKTRAQHNTMTLEDNYVDVLDRVKGGMKPFNAVLSLFHGTIKAVRNGRVSFERQKQAYESKLIGEVTEAIIQEKPHIMRLLSDGQFDEAVTRELMELGPKGTPGSTGNSDASWLAARLNQQLKLSRVILNRFGSPLEDSVGYTGPESHNDVKINKHEKEWTKDLLSGMLNLEASFPGLNPQKDKAAIQKIIGEAYLQIIQGKNNAFGTTLGSRTEEPPITSNFVFMDANAAIAYQKKWGYTSTVASIINTLSSRAHDAALIERFGHNPSQGLNKLLTKLRKQIESAGGDKAETANLQASNFEFAVNIATGQVNHIQDHTLARLGSELRGTTQMALLGKASLAAMPADTITMALSSMFRGDGFFRGFMGAIFKSMDGLTPEERLELSAAYYEGLDSIVGHLNRAALAEDGRVGTMSRLSHHYFKLNLLTPWTDSRRGMQARMIASQLGRNSDKTFDQLHWRLKNVLEQNGIGQYDWEHIRKLARTASNGQKYIYPEGFENLQGLTKWEKDKLELNLRGYIADEVNMGMLEGGDWATYHQVIGSGRRGTWSGEAARMITQFTTFPMVFSQRVFGRSILGIPGDTAGERIMRNSAHIATMWAGMLAASYASWTLKELAKGNTPPLPTAENGKDFMGKLLVDSGVAGWYGAVVFDAILNHRTPGMGPVPDAAFNELSAIGELLNGDFDKAATIQYDTIIQNTPGANLFYLRPVLDALFLNSIDEFMHPRRAEQREKTREKYQQERIWSE